MSAAVSVFKLCVQSVRQMQQHAVEVSFKMTELPYQLTPVANHSMTIARQSSARQCRLVLAHIAPHTIQRTEIWRLKYQRGYFEVRIVV